MCMYMYVCMVYVCVFPRVCMYEAHMIDEFISGLTYPDSGSCVCMYVYMYMYVCMYVCVSIWRSLCACMYIFHTAVCVFLCMRMYEAHVCDELIACTSRVSQLNRLSFSPH